MGDKISKPQIAIIGAGRLGTVLTRCLMSAGYPISAIITRKPRRTRTNLPSLSKQTLLLSPSQLKRLPLPSVLIVAVPDDQISTLAKLLAGTPGVSQSQGLILHTSGALASDVFEPLAKLGWKTGSAHPLIAVSNNHSGPELFDNSHWCLEGHRSAKAFAKKMVADLGGHFFSVSAHSKPLYHAAAVMASGNLVALIDVAVSMLVACGIPRRSALEILTPLTESALKNLVSTPEGALTGPFVRGDFKTVKLHLKALSHMGSDVRELYRLLGLRSIQLAEQRGVDQRSLLELRKLLKE